MVDLQKQGEDFRLGEHTGAFVLTVDAPDGARRRNVFHQLEDLDLNWEFVVGADKAQNSMMKEYSRFLNLFFHKRSLTRGEVAVYVGHRMIWRKIIEKNLDYGIVFEDDFCISDKHAFLSVLSDCLACHDQWDLVKFFNYRPKRVVIRKKVGNSNVVSYKYTASGMVAYIISRMAAEKLLRKARFYRPVDEDISHMWEFPIRVWSTSPNLVYEIGDELGGSLLEAERSKQRAKKNIVRSIWGNFLQGWKLTRAYTYRHRMNA